MHFIQSLIAAASVLNLVAALTPAQWRSQSIYQVLPDRFAQTSGSTSSPCDPADMVYCNGTWAGLINHLDYIQGMGFTAIWISPVVQNAEGGYHGYWAQNIYEVNNNFGSPQDLHLLSDALHSRGMYLMIDVVTNHVGYNGCQECVDYKTFNPFNDVSYYHPICDIDYDNMTSVVECWYGGDVAMPDLRTETPEVVAEFSTWISQMVSNYSIDGIRLDSGMEIDVEFYLPFQEAAGVYVMSEVLTGDPEQFCSYQEYTDGPLNYVSYFWISRAFGSTDYGFHEIAWGINMLQDECTDTTLLGSFMENHDQPRFPFTQNDVVLAQNAMAFTILQDGIPIIYQGQEQHLNGGESPLNREALWLSGYNTQSTLYQWIKQINGIRNYIISKSSGFVTYYNTAIYNTQELLVTRKGVDGAQLVSIFTNVGSGTSNQTLELDGGDTGFEPNQYVIDMVSCAVYQANPCGNLTVSITNGLPVALFPAVELKGSSICSQDAAEEIAMPTPAPENLSATSSLVASTSVLATSSVISHSTSVLLTSSLASAAHSTPASSPSAGFSSTSSSMSHSSSSSVLATSSQYVFPTSSAMTFPTASATVSSFASSSLSTSISYSTSVAFMASSSSMSTSSSSSSSSLASSSSSTSSSTSSSFVSTNVLPSSTSSSLIPSLAPSTSSLPISTSTMSSATLATPSNTVVSSSSSSISSISHTTSSSSSPSSSLSSSSSKPAVSSSSTLSTIITPATAKASPSAGLAAASTLKTTTSSSSTKITSSSAKSTSTSSSVQKSTSTSSKKTTSSVPKPAKAAKTTPVKAVKTKKVANKAVKTKKPAVRFAKTTTTTEQATKTQLVKLGATTPTITEAATPTKKHKKQLAKRSQTTSTCGACITAVAMTFSASNAPALLPGEHVEIVGSVPQLSSWNPSYGIGMTNSTTGNVWSTTVTFTPGQVIQYKYIVVDVEGNVNWEADPNHTVTVPTGCVSTTAVKDTWQTWPAKA